MLKLSSSCLQLMISCSLFSTRGETRKSCHPLFFKTCPGLQASSDQSPRTLQTASVFPNLWQQRCWDVWVRTALTFQQGREGQTMAPLTRFWPPPAQHQLTWKKQPSKKCCWLLTGMPVCCCWVEFEPCIDYPNGAEQCCCLLRITFSSSVWWIAHSYT